MGIGSIVIKTLKFKVTEQDKQVSHLLLNFEAPPNDNVTHLSV
jgi:hypothetical protein